MLLKKNMLDFLVCMSLLKEARENPFGAHVPLAGGAASLGTAAGIFFCATVFFVTAGTSKIIIFLKNVNNKKSNDRHITAKKTSE